VSEVQDEVEEPYAPKLAAAHVEGWIPTEAKSGALEEWVQRRGLNAAGTEYGGPDNDPRRHGEQALRLLLTCTPSRQHFFNTMQV